MGEDPYFCEIAQIVQGVDVRAVKIGEVCWFSMVDLFAVVRAVTPSGTWPPIQRVPNSVLSAFLKRPIEDIIRPFKAFGIGIKGMSKTGHFLSEVAAPAFLDLSGYGKSDSRSSLEIVSEMVDRVSAAFASNSREAPLAEVAAEGGPEEGADYLKLNQRLAETQRVVGFLLKSNEALRAELSRMQHMHDLDIASLRRRLGEIEDDCHEHRKGETSSELKKQAARLYARSKQLENEGM